MERSSRIVRCPVWLRCCLVFSLLGLWGCTLSNSPAPKQTGAIPELPSQPSEQPVSNPAELVQLSTDLLKPTPLAPAIDLPPMVGGRILSTAVQDQELPLEQLTITASRDRQWRDGCLDIATVDQLCTQVITPGWQAIVSDGQRQWVYHSDAQGEVIKLNAIASSGNAVQISFGPLAQLGQLDGSVLSAFASVGMDSVKMDHDSPPSPTRLALLINGSVMQLQDDVISSNSSHSSDASPAKNDSARSDSYKLTPQQIQNFDQQRNQANLRLFDGLRYSQASTSNSFLISIIDSQAFFQYDPSLGAQLPESIQQMNLAWQTVICADPLSDCVAPAAPSALKR